MSLRVALALICLLISLACVGGGLAVAGQWGAAGLVLLPVIAAPFYRKYPAPWLLSACLVSLVCLAAVGLLLAAPTIPMILGAAAGLAAWDLANLDRTMEGSSPSKAASDFEGKHILFLAGALGLGLLMAATGLVLSFRIPFVVLIILIVVDLFSLDRLSRHLRNRTARG